MTRLATLFGALPYSSCRHWNGNRESRGRRGSGCAIEQTLRTAARRLRSPDNPGLAGCARPSQPAGAIHFRSSSDALRPVLCALAAFGQPHGDGADDQQPGDTRAHAGCIDGDLLRPACNRRIDHHRRHIAQPQRFGLPAIPGLYDAAKVSAWRATTAAVHANGGKDGGKGSGKGGGKIFVQFMHCGRVAHVANLPTGAEVLGPGTVVCPGEMYTDTLGDAALQPAARDV